MLSTGQYLYVYAGYTESKILKQFHSNASKNKIETNHYKRRKTRDSQIGFYTAIQQISNRTINHRVNQQRLKSVGKDSVFKTNSTVPTPRRENEKRTTSITIMIIGEPHTDREKEIEGDTEGKNQSLPIVINGLCLLKNAAQQ